MTCERWTLPDGTKVIACSRTRRPRPRWCECGMRATRQCDFPVRRRGKPGTCDRHLCNACAVVVAPRIEGGERDTLDHCREHANAPAEQLSLF